MPGFQFEIKDNVIVSKNFFSGKVNGVEIESYRVDPMITIDNFINGTKDLYCPTDLFFAINNNSEMVVTFSKISSG